jgi:hypothetical protein
MNDSMTDVATTTFVVRGRAAAASASNGGIDNLLSLGKASTKDA